MKFKRLNQLLRIGPPDVSPDRIDAAMLEAFEAVKDDGLIFTRMPDGALLASYWIEIDR